MELRENILFADRYRLLRLLGRGGFSEVWLASDEKTGLRVAVKVYAPGSSLDEDGVRLFTEELSIVYNLNHSNLLKPHYFDECGGCPYLVLPYCERGSAQRLIGKLTEEEAWRFLHDVSAGLEYLHAKEPPVIHQDIKPDNVLRDASGTFMITDFGISTRARSTLRRSVSHAEHSGGTMEYMGPERFGEKPAPIKASDIWSLGATLFELLTGSVPFVQLGGILQMNGALLPAIEGPWSERLKEVVKACLSKDPWDRPTAHALREYVESFWRGENPELKKTGEGGAVYSRNVSPLNFFGKRVWVGFLLLLLICGGGIVYYLSSGGPKENKLLKTQFGTSEKDSVRLVRDTITLAASKKSGEECIDGHQDTIGIENSEKQKKLPVKRQTLRNGLTINWSPSVTPKQKEVLSRLVGNMVKVDGGSFQMGATPEQGNEARDDEKPVHTVTLNNYYIGKYEVTQSEWKVVMGSNPSFLKGNNLPVENVCWDDIPKFLQKLNVLTGLDFKLPTEAQWEYAARGGNLSKGYKYSGSDDLNEVSWYWINSGDRVLAGEFSWEEIDRNHCRMHPVGEKCPNELGLYDMSGNVDEWCEDGYGNYSSNSQTDPVGTGSVDDDFRAVLRGGNWHGEAKWNRVSARSREPTISHFDCVGLRLVL
ncbi:SUMF1/EgtB/PvdO family nonheme iron enzyme [Odoribacter laneus]|uniref:SUMF1/EgtB/PvdO family nonheme iron enzyme n=1 Tax=Odoribacter laneus TaxID=626933 RepID=UPI003994CC22